MHLTMFSDLSLRVVMRLAAGKPDERFTAARVAGELNASRAHVAKVVSRLAEMGLVVAVKGRNGGIFLADGALDRSVGGILRELEVGEVVDCEGTQCPLTPGCRLRHALAEAQEAFFAHLDGVVIGDLVPPSAGPVLVELLATPSDGGRRKAGAGGRGGGARK